MKKVLILIIVFTILSLSSCTSKNMSGESQVDKQSKNESFVSFTKESQVDNQSKNESSVSFTKESQVDKQTENDDSVSFTKEKKYWKTLLKFDDQIADKTFEQVLVAIQDQDADALKSLFSKNAIKEAQNFDESMKQLFDFFQGKLVSYEQPSGRGTTKDNKYGNKQIIVQTPYDVVTSKAKYHVIVKQCTKDTLYDPDNVGIMSICIINQENWKHDYMYRGNGKLDMPGIHIEKNVIE